MRLRTLWRNGARLSLLLTTCSELFLLQRGWYPPSLRSHSSRRSLRLDPSATQLAPEIDSRSLGPQSGKETHTNPLPSERPSPFNAVFRHSMRGNTVQRKVWSHAANSGKLFFVTEGLRGQSKWGP